jgi:hypothetical protein
MQHLTGHGKLGSVKLNVDHEDERGFKSARDLLLGQFTIWLAREGRLYAEETDELIGDAGVALDWKWTYGDGELATWRTSDIAEFLLEWCPRKLSVTQADCVTIPVALVSFLSFLDEEDLLGPGSAPVDRLIEAVTVLAKDFVEAMGDRSNFGLAKSMFTAASDEGVDLSDPEEAQLWMERFNGRSEEERHRLLPDSAFAAPLRRRSLPPVAVPSDDELAASREAAPILAMFRDFAAYVGPGRKLTQKGNLSLADARALVDLLGTGDLMDEKIGDHTFRTTSSDNLYHLRQVFAWAKKAGVLRVVHGKVVATKQGLGLAGGLAGSFDRAVDALMAIGPLTSQRFPDNWFSWPEVDGVLDKVSAHLLIAPTEPSRRSLWRTSPPPPAGWCSTRSASRWMTTGWPSGWPPMSATSWMPSNWPASSAGSTSPIRATADGGRGDRWCSPRRVSSASGVCWPTPATRLPRPADSPTPPPWSFWRAPTGTTSPLSMGR